MAVIRKKARPECYFWIVKRGERGELYGNIAHCERWKKAVGILHLYQKAYDT